MYQSLLFNLTLFSSANAQPCTAFLEASGVCLMSLGAQIFTHLLTNQTLQFSAMSTTQCRENIS